MSLAATPRRAALPMVQAANIQEVLKAQGEALTSVLLSFVQLVSEHSEQTDKSIKALRAENSQLRCELGLPSQSPSACTTPARTPRPSPRGTSSRKSGSLSSPRGTPRASPCGSPLRGSQSIEASRVSASPLETSSDRPIDGIIHTSAMTDAGGIPTNSSVASGNVTGNDGCRSAVHELIISPRAAIMCPVLENSVSMETSTQVVACENPLAQVADSLPSASKQIVSSPQGPVTPPRVAACFPTVSSGHQVPKILQVPPLPQPVRSAAGVEAMLEVASSNSIPDDASIQDDIADSAGAHREAGGGSGTGEANWLECRAAENFSQNDACDTRQGSASQLGLATPALGSVSEVIYVESSSPNFSENLPDNTLHQQADATSSVCISSEVDAYKYAAQRYHEKLLFLEQEIKQLQKQLAEVSSVLDNQIAINASFRKLSKSRTEHAVAGNVLSGLCSQESEIVEIHRKLAVVKEEKGNIEKQLFDSNAFLQQEVVLNADLRELSKEVLGASAAGALQHISQAGTVEMTEIKLYQKLVASAEAQKEQLQKQLADAVSSLQKQQVINGKVREVVAYSLCNPSLTSS